MNAGVHVLYWDASAVISTLVCDVHSNDALALLEQDHTHLISNLAHAEVCAVIARLFHSGSVGRPIVQGIFHAYKNGPWQEVLAQPDRDDLERLGMMVSLRGADLWHIACISALREDLAEIALLTYDDRMRAAACSLSIPLVNGSASG